MAGDALCRDLLLKLLDVQIMHLLLNCLAQRVTERATVLVIIVTKNLDVDISNVLQVRQRAQSRHKRAYGGETGSPIAQLADLYRHIWVRRRLAYAIIDVDTDIKPFDGRESARKQRHTQTNIVPDGQAHFHVVP